MLHAVPPQTPAPTDTATALHEAQMALALAKAARQALQARLADANLRVAELQTRVAEQDVKLAALSAQCEAAFHVQETALQGVDLFPAAKLAQATRAFTVVQRRDLWLTLLVQLGLGGRLMGLAPHDGGDGPLCVLAYGSGGVGDVLHLTAAVAGLHQAFPQALLFVAHTHPSVREVFAQNPHVIEAVAMTSAQIDAMVRQLVSLDIFDLLAEVRYVASYTAPTLSRVPASFLIQAHARAAPWQRHVRHGWPYNNNALGAEAIQAGLDQFALLGHTGNLAVSAGQGGALYPAKPLPDHVADILRGKAYITIHHGADPNMSARSGVQTKNVPLDLWVDVVRQCQLQTLFVVQLGLAEEVAVPGVSLDLRGQTNLHQTALVLKHASVHVDTEGGLVHLAKAMGTDSVVMFGPTPIGFFGYAGNENLAPTVCGSCWWLTATWAQACVRGDTHPACMASHTAARIQPALDRVMSRAVKHLELGSKGAPPRPIQADATIGIVMCAPVSVAHLKDLADLKGHVHVLLPQPVTQDSSFSQMVTRLGWRQVIITDHHVPLARDVLDALIIVAPSAATLDHALLAECLRICKLEAELSVFEPPGGAPFDICGQTREMVARMPGLRFALSQKPAGPGNVVRIVAPNLEDPKGSKPVSRLPSLRVR